jgi:acetylornithine aminotransferase
VLLEPIQGEGGIYPLHADYLKELRVLCDQKQWLLMLDEIQTGVGRTGALYDYMNAEIVPDVLTTAKGLGNGIPVSACLMKGPACNLFKPGNHGSTFGGNPLASIVALTVLERIEKENLLSHVQNISRQLIEQLQSALQDKPYVKQIRGKGLMLGIELDRPAREAIALGIEAGILFNVTADRVIRLLPPLIINQAEVDLLCERLVTTLDNFASL